MPTYRSHFPDFIGMVTKRGDKFNFTGGLLETDDTEIMEILDERAAKQKDVTKIADSEAGEIRAANAKLAAQSGIEDRMSANPDGETTISPQALMDRIRMTQAAQANASAASSQLEVASAGGVRLPQTGVVSSATLEAAAPSNAAKPVAPSAKR